MSLTGGVITVEGHPSPRAILLPTQGSVALRTGKSHLGLESPDSNLLSPGRPSPTAPAGSPKATPPRSPSGL